MTYHKIQWAIVSPNYDAILCVRYTRKESIVAFCEDANAWKRWYRRGLRAVKVNVELI